MCNSKMPIRSSDKVVRPSIVLCVCGRHHKPVWPGVLPLRTIELRWLADRTIHELRTCQLVGPHLKEVKVGHNLDREH